MIDFVVAGQEKAGTTALFKCLGQHPEIFLPLEKELPFFEEVGITENEVKEFFNIHFSFGSKINGTVSPQYFCETAAENLRKFIGKDLKVLIILRDPFERALSRYRMHCRRNAHEFKMQSFYDQLNSELVGSKDMWLLDCFSTHHIINKYAALFGENLFLLRYDEFCTNPSGFVENVQEILGVRKLALPVTNQFQSGKPKSIFLQRFRNLNIWGWVKNTVFHRYALLIAIWFDRWNISPDGSYDINPEEINPTINEYLKSDYNLTIDFCRDKFYWLN